MFKTISLFRIAPLWQAQAANMEAALSASPFVECGASQEKSLGWVPPREVNGAFVESVAGQYILKFRTEAKSVPSSAIQRKLDDYITKVEAETGRKPGKKERKEFKEDAKLSLLPMAFSKQSDVVVWIDQVAKLLVLSTASTSKSDEVISQLVKALEGFSVSPLATNQSCPTAMSSWLTQQVSPLGFTIDRDCTLKAADESKAVVRYTKHALDIEEINQHITGGKVPTQLGLTWMDRVSFTLNDNLTIKKISFLDGVFDGTSQEKEDGFDADVAISTGELRKLIPDLIAALGGEVSPF
jgi:recombination associated protein RdgC